MMLADASPERSLLLEALAFTSCGVTLADAQGPDLPLVYVNPAFVDMTGYSPEEALGRNCRFLQRSDRDQAALATVRLAIREARHCRVVVKNYHKDGSPFWNELNISPIVEGGELTHFVGIQTDVTQRIEARRRANELTRRLQEVNRQLKDFASTLSHDLRSPLQVIHRLCKQLQEDHADELSAEASRLVELLAQRGSRIDRRVHGILEYSRVSRSALRIEDIDLDRLVADVVDLLDVPPGVELQIDPLPTIPGDRALLTHVFQNLIDNAIRHLGRDHGRVEVGGSADDEGWRFHVRDDGPGIPPELQRLVFDMFKTGRSPDTPAGLGIGLPIVRRSLEKLDGRLWLDSTPGEGTSVFFHLPRRGRQAKG